ncbi:MAG: tRNA 2-thiouridine(34) synthase MnmA [Firmicutes bacterium]|nr:tRNA 2-thiouridine(34) synthase MnmA [Bacillota bacterium]
MVAMSGGVDSSVAAVILKEQGYDVVGATIKLWPEYIEPLDEGGCCSLSAVEDARRVANKLEIPFYVLNMQAEFQKLVIDRFSAEYARGRTPNPCIECNRSIKFGKLLSMAKKLDIEYVATGHYARIHFQDGRYRLLRGTDNHKDQSYTLYALGQELLAKILFPVGEYTKDQIRAKASEIGLRVANKPDSQEICFIPDNDYKQFLELHGQVHSQPGDIVDQQGNVLGRHQGIHNFTIGQRKGLGISAEAPLYVIDINPETNQIVVGHNLEVFSRSFRVADFTWTSGVTPSAPFTAEAKIRYHADPHPAEVIPSGDFVQIRFLEPQRAITPGQSAVVYDGEEVLGGGIILSRD